MALFGHGEELLQVLEDIAKINSRLDDIENSMAAYRKQLVEICRKISDIKAETQHPSSEVCTINSNASSTIDSVDSSQSHSLRPPTGEQGCSSFYLAPPASDGTFLNFSPTVQIGKSVYELTTADGVNGTFSMIDSDDALATAMISVSQFVKSVCRIEGNTRVYPTHISTIEKGVAVMENGKWKVSKKAIVRFE